MNKIIVLHIGIKYWPFIDEVKNNSSLKGIRGGGMNKYCDMLINSFPAHIHSIIICQRLPGQHRTETIGNITVYRIRTAGSRGIRQILANILSFFYALRIIGKEKVNILHGHMTLGIYIVNVLGQLFKKPVIATPYSFTTSIGLNFVYNKISQFLEKRYYKKVDCLVFESIENRAKAEKYLNAHYSNSVVINTGITIPEKINSTSDSCKINILYIGRLVTIKALDKLILSLLHTSDSINAQIHINIVGEGELAKELNNLIISNNLSDLVTLHGYVEDSTPMFLNNDIFILPSYQEGLSISLLEAMSYGLACIVNNFGVPFTKDTVFEMENNNPETIAKAITYLISEKEIMNRLKVSSREEIKNRFSIQSCSNEYCKIYNKFKK